MFCTGASRVPPIGFKKNPTLEFTHTMTETLPTASTCDLILRLPTVHECYEDFRQFMIPGLFGHDGFGGV